MKRLIAFACTFALMGATHATDWEMSAEQPKNNYLTQNAVQFAEEVKEATNGALNITVTPNSALLTRPEVKHEVQQGTVPLAEVLVATLGNEDPLFEVDSVPLLVTSFDDAEKLWHASRKLFAERLDEQGLVLLYGSPWPPQGIYSKNPVNDLKDLAGVKFRAYNNATSRLVELMGAEPIMVQTPEIPQAFSAGMIDAMLTSPATGVDSHAWDYVNYYYDAQVFIPQSFVIANKEQLKALPKDIQDAVFNAAKQAEARGWQMARDKTAGLTRTLAEHGMEVNDLSKSLKEELSVIGDKIAQEWRDKAGPDGKKILDAYEKQ